MHGCLTSRSGRPDADQRIIFGDFVATPRSPSALSHLTHLPSLPRSTSRALHSQAGLTRSCSQPWTAVVLAPHRRECPPTPRSVTCASPRGCCACPSFLALPGGVWPPLAPSGQRTHLPPLPLRALPTRWPWRRARTFVNTRTTRWIGSRGVRLRLLVQWPSRSQSSSLWATAPVIGATSWSAKASRARLWPVCSTRTLCASRLIGRSGPTLIGSI